MRRARDAMSARHSTATHGSSTPTPPRLMPIRLHIFDDGESGRGKASRRPARRHARSKCQRLPQGRESPPAAWSSCRLLGDHALIVCFKSGSRLRPHVVGDDLGAARIRVHAIHRDCTPGGRRPRGAGNGISGTL
jgi:hypothetical protein